jgi:hypothetical protein
MLLRRPFRRRTRRLWRLPLRSTCRPASRGIRRRHRVVFWGVLGVLIAVVAIVVLKSVAFLILELAVLLSIYFAPALVAMRRDHQVARVIV